MEKKKYVKQFEGASVEVFKSEGDAELKYLVGYATTWDNVDLVGDIMRKGSFKKTLNEKVPAEKILLMAVHIANGGNTKEAIGVVVDAKEDTEGVWYKAELYNTQLARETHEKIERSPNAFGSSVGFKALNYKKIVDKNNNVTGYEFLENELDEITVTVSPCNTQTTIQAKHLDELEARIKKLEDNVQQTAKEQPAACTTDEAGTEAGTESETENAESSLVSTKDKRARMLSILETL